MVMAIYVGEYSYTFSLGQIALLHRETQCPVSKIFSSNNAVTEAAEVVDSDESTCFEMAGNEKKWRQISLPFKHMESQFYVWLLGNLECSPLNGLNVYIFGDCESGPCKNSVCIASDYVTDHEIRGCMYRCHRVGIRSSIVVDFVSSSDIAQPKSICEIVY